MSHASSLVHPDGIMGFAEESEFACCAVMFSALVVQRSVLVCAHTPEFGSIRRG